MAMHFPANAGLIFLTDELTNDRYLVDTGATLSGFHLKNCAIPRQTFFIQFFASRCGWSHSGH
jgi:hypothetical protein